MFDLLYQSGPFLSTESKEHVTYLYSSFASITEIINILLIHKGNRISQLELEQFCFCLVQVTKDKSDLDEIVNNHVKTGRTLILWRMFFCDNSESSLKIKEALGNKVRSLSEEKEKTIDTWIERWPEDKEYVH